MTTMFELCEEYGVNVKRTRAPCPIHHGSNVTSFKIWDDGFYCHSCGQKGNTAKFVSIMEEIPIIKAMEKYPTATKPVDERIKRHKSFLRDSFSIYCDLMMDKKIVVEKKIEELSKLVSDGKMSAYDFYCREQDFWYDFDNQDATIHQKYLECRYDVEIRIDEIEQRNHRRTH